MKYRCSSASALGPDKQCMGIAHWISMNGTGTPTQMIWCDECQAKLIEAGRYVGESQYRKLTKKLKAKLDRPWHLFPTTSNHPRPVPE